jgi:hypothetical protein
MRHREDLYAIAEPEPDPRPENQNTDAGNSAGAASLSTGSPVTMAWSNGSDYWGAITVEAQRGCGR